MKPNRVRLLARLSFAFVASLAVGLPAGLVTQASAQPFITAEDRCRADLAVGTRRYLESVLRARIICENKIIAGELPGSTECVTGRGDSRLDVRLRKAEDKLTNMGRACVGVDLGTLGFPGSCTDTTGIPFDTEDMKLCVMQQTDVIVPLLLDYYFPPISDFFRGSAAKCLKGSAQDASMSFRRTLRARETCLLGQDVGLVTQSVKCREEILPYGPGTGDGEVDAEVSRAYLQLLGAIPEACVEVQIDDLDYQSTCVDQTGGIFTIFDLKNCFFKLNRDQITEALQIAFPNDPFCGDGNVNGAEECDLGAANNSDTKPDTCRTDCTNPRCHDGVTDTGHGEQCDDGNTVNGDCCSGECQTDVCGDGVKTCTEQCDNGTSNSNTTPNACRTDCKNWRCGDGTKDSPEDCDDGNTNDCDGCSSLCFVESCGDDIVQTCRGEQCDDGVDNANLPNKCRTNCKLPTCPDGIVDNVSNGEDCDDGNTIDTDACPNTCAVCGNNKKAQTEDCDGTDPVTSCTSEEICNEDCDCEVALDGCPNVGELTLFAGVGDDCTTNADCVVGDCDLTLGKCRTITRLDSGWNGAAHNADINNRVRTRGKLDCPGLGPVCGQCNITGVDPSIRSCRCATQIRTICDDPFVASPDCPSCVGGNTKAGRECAANPDCLDAATCTFDAKVCSNSATTTCTKSSDCVSPGVCGPTTKKACSTLKTKLCTSNTDCSFQGTCTGQATCNCYFGSPFPLSSGGTPACVVNRFANNITGTANVDLGVGQITANLRTVVYIGPNTKAPCPTCGGLCSNNAAKYCDRDEDCSGGTCTLDPVHDDGNRGGVCTSGESVGQSCDVAGFNTSFPAYADGPSGGGYSLDCLPKFGSNISGTGLIINLTQSTGTSELHSVLPCDTSDGADPSVLCPCLQCSGDNTVPCNTDDDCSTQRGSCERNSATFCDVNADCAAVNLGFCNPSTSKCSSGFGIDCASNADCSAVDIRPCNTSTCSSSGSGKFPEQNNCDDKLCTALPDGTGICTNGPDELYCEGVVRGNGRGVLSCFDDEGCSPDYVGVDARPCGLVERRLCFPEPIRATGVPSPTEPVGAATFCVPPSGSFTIDTAAGLPGPGRIVNQATSKTFCASDPTKTKLYIPGVGGCLD